jgi:transcriptional regulator with PAS, ATPase and Fis domain
MQSDFVISGDTVHVDYKQYETGLQRWLLMKVLREEPNVTRAAERLNISKKTVYMWLEKFKLSL